MAKAPETSVSTPGPAPRPKAASPVAAATDASTKNDNMDRNISEPLDLIDAAIVDEDTKMNTSLDGSYVAV